MFDNPIFFLILISLISAISEWIGKRRRAAAEAQEASNPSRGAAADPRAASGRLEPGRKGEDVQELDWEDRLKRLLEGEDPARSERSRTRERAESPQVELYVEPERPRTPQPVPVAPPPVPRASKPAVKVEGVREASDYVRPVAKPSQPIPADSPMILKRPRVRRGGASDVSNFRSRKALRQAIVASVVLGPPKASGENPDLIPL